MFDIGGQIQGQTTGTGKRLEIMSNFVQQSGPKRQLASMGTGQLERPLSGNQSFDLEFDLQRSKMRSKVKVA